MRTKTIEKGSSSEDEASGGRRKRLKRDEYVGASPPAIETIQRRRTADSYLSDGDQSVARQTPLTIGSAPEDGEGSASEEPEGHVVLFLGKHRQKIPQSRFLHHIWGKGLDSPCHLCGKDFTEETGPVIRTVTFHVSEKSPETRDFTQVALSPNPLHIHNRHFECIRARKIDYVAVSHAWHEEVSTAQTEKTTDLGVARLVYQTPVQTLLALTRKFGRTEIWHDYLSVPQWQRDVQAQLLLRIPAIYSYPLNTLVHLDDVRAEHLTNIRTKQPYPQFKEGLLAITNSRWFERMWVTLEYIQGKDIAILTEDLVLPEYRYEAAPPPGQADYAVHVSVACRTC
jgi:hypothetical protein